jgi:anaerobic selenocysteine-containing dehydrogenase
MATTGNLDVPGGNIYHRALRQTSLRVKGRVKVDEAIGAQYPIYGRFTSETTSMPVPEAIISGRPYPVKALIIQGSNSLLTWPNTTKINEAFSKLDLLVVADMFMTKTGELADVFLPAASFLEQEVLQDYSFVGQPLLALGNKVMEPIGNCLEDWRMWAELGKRMGYSSYFPWQDTDELFQTLLEPSDITLKLLRENPGGILYESLDKTRKYLKEGFATPSGKFEIFSSTMEKYGYEPLPNFAEPAGGPISPSDLSGEYPFILVTGTRVNAFTHSRFRDIAKLRKLAPEPLVEINTDSAKRMGIANGEMVNVISPKGSIKLRAKLTDDIHPKVVSLQHGWAGANANILISDEELDPTSAYPAFKGQLCQVIKAE